MHLFLKFMKSLKTVLELSGRMSRIQIRSVSDPVPGSGTSDNHLGSATLQIWKSGSNSVSSSQNWNPDLEENIQDQQNDVSSVRSGIFSPIYYGTDQYTINNFKVHSNDSTNAEHTQHLGNLMYDPLLASCALFRMHLRIRIQVLKKEIYFSFKNYHI